MLEESEQRGAHAEEEVGALRDALRRSELEASRALDAEVSLKAELAEAAARADEAQKQLAATEETSLEEAERAQGPRRLVP